MSRLLSHEIDATLTANALRRIDRLLSEPKGLPNGKGKRTRLQPTDAQKLRSSLVDAVHFAAVFASNGQLPNRVRGRGRPPDNAIFIFIDDIMRACKAAGLKPGLRYVAGSESLPVHAYNELAPLLWPGHPVNPRRLFQRWQRYRPSLIRTEEEE
jgi:hypothetical protein